MADHSPLPWRPADNGVWDADGVAVAQSGRSLDGQANRDYIVRAANAYPLAEEMARWVAEQEWGPVDNDDCRICPDCGLCQGHLDPPQRKHRPDCELARLLQAARDAGLLADQPNRRAEP